MVPVQWIDIQRHQEKDVEKALVEFREAGWLEFENSSGHGQRLGCPHACQCIVRVSSTPQNAGNMANRMLRELRRCPMTPLPGEMTDADSSE